MSVTPITKQADLLANYLIDRPIDNPLVYKIFEIAVSNNETREDSLLSFAFKHPYFIPALDAALVFLRPHSELRRRIYTLFAILESTPEHADLFLPQKFHFIDVITLLLVGVRAVYRVPIGVIIIKMGRL